MKKCFAAFFLIYLTLQLHAQQVDLQWAVHAGSTSVDGAYSVTTDAAGNVYSAGEFKGNVDFDPGPGTFFLNSGSPFLSNSFILKLSPTGNFIWAKQVRQLTSGDNLSGNIVIDITGAIYYSSQLFGTVDADPGPGVFSLGNPGSNGEAFITKLDASGNFVWARIFGGNNSGIEDMKLDQAGNVYAAGFFQGTVDFDPGAAVYPLTSNGFADIVVFKLNTNGDFLWAGAMGNPSVGDYAYGMEVSSSGEVYCTGVFSGTVDFDPGAGVHTISTAGGTFNTFLLKLNPNGSYAWAKFIDGDASNLGWSVTLDNNNNIVVAGSFAGTADLDPGPGASSHTSAGSLDIYILKLNASGDFVWAKQAGGIGYDGPNPIATDQQGNVYVSGYFNETVDFDPGPATTNLTSAGGTDVYILKLDPAGNFAWVKQVVGNGPTDYGIGLFVDAAYNVYVSGMFEAVADFDPSPAVYNLGSNGQRDAFILKLARCLQVTSSTLNITACETYTLNGQTYTAAGTYTQTVLNSAGCDSIITLNLTITGKSFTSISKSICEGQSYYAGGANQTTSGIYKDTLLTSLGCDSIITTALTVNPNPKPDLGPDRNLCVDASTSVTPGSFSSYLWQDNSTQPFFTVSTLGIYWVTVTTANNCSATDTLKILTIDTIPKNFLPANQELCYGNELKISVPGYADYLWSMGSTSPDVSLNGFGTFYLTVKDFNNCSGTDSIIIQRKNCIYIGIPNAFTPNKDGKNDIFRPTINQSIQQYSFAIFNRYGEKIFETHEYGQGWNGTYKGKDQPTGAYVYRIVYSNIFGYVSENNGTVLLIR